MGGRYSFTWTLHTILNLSELYGGREPAHAEVSVRGFSFTPPPKSVPQAAIEDARLYELLALVDTLRMAGSANANRPGSN